MSGDGDRTDGPAGKDDEEAEGLWLSGIWDEHVEPQYARRFAELLLRTVSFPPRAQVLFAGCATGSLIGPILDRIDGQSRIIALEARGPLLTRARARVAELDRKRVFLKGESIRKLKFADKVFNLVVSNLTWMDLPEPGVALKEFARVLVPGGGVALTLPLRGTLQEVYDLFAEVILKYDLGDVRRRLEEHMLRSHPDEREARGLLTGVGLEEVSVVSEEHTLTFANGKEIFESPLIKALFEPRWSEIVGVHWDTLRGRTREAIDIYFEGEPLSVRVVAGCLRGSRPTER